MSSVSFAHEQSVYPFTHAVVNTAFYLTVRDIRWAIIGFFAWEPFERLLAQVIPALVETCDDSIFGDPLIGLLAILPFWILDWTTGFDVVFCRHAHPLARALVFIVIAATSFIAPQLTTTTVYWGIALYTAIYLATLLIGYGHLLFGRNRSTEVAYAGLSIAIWALAVVIYAIISLVVLDGPLLSSSWMRIFFVQCAFLLASLGGLLSVPQH